MSEQRTSAADPQAARARWAPKAGKRYAASPITSDPLADTADPALSMPLFGVPPEVKQAGPSRQEQVLGNPKRALFTLLGRSFRV